jgi:hypothetical protein
MASEKQIAANRRNARNSTGPRTKAGKKRASLNAMRHGLASQSVLALRAEQVEILARQIAGGSKSVIVLAHARCAAGAVLDLAQVRQARADLVEWACSLGSLDPPRYFRKWRDELRWLVSQDYAELRKQRGEPPC